MHVVEIVVAAALLYLDVRYFLLFWFVFYLFISFRKFMYLSALIRVTAFAQEAKIAAVAKKLGVTDEEIKAEITAVEVHNPQAWKNLQKDFEVINP